MEKERVAAPATAAVPPAPRLRFPVRRAVRVSICRSSSGYSDSESYSTSESEADIPIFFPVPFSELSSIQYYTLDEQLTKLTAALKTQFQRHCFIQIRQQETQPMLVPFVEPVTTFTYNRSMLDYYIKRQHDKQKAACLTNRRPRCLSQRWQ